MIRDFSNFTPDFPFSQILNAQANIRRQVTELKWYARLNHLN